MFPLPFAERRAVSAARDEIREHFVVSARRKFCLYRKSPVSLEFGMDVIKEGEIMIDHEDRRLIVHLCVISSICLSSS
ncbi:hypothetical protein PAAL109150_18690 [Paenibacillus alkaliterrae]